MSSGETDSSSPGSSPGTSGLSNLEKAFGGSSKLSFSIDSILDPHFGTPKTHFRPISITQPASPAVSPPKFSFSGSRCRRIRKRESPSEDEKRPRTAFTPQQLQKLKQQFVDNRYLTEKRRQELAHELGLNESQIKIWFQNKRAKLKKAQGEKPSLALHLMAQGMYNPSVVIGQHCTQI